jgi:ubiquinone biosynthesis protein
VDDLFLSFDDEPIASASIGQVHRARLLNGDLVVVKVQHEGVQDTVHKDLDVLGGLAQLFQRLPELAPYRPVETVAEFQRTLRRELDFGREERNLQQFHSRFADNPHICIPRPISELCTPRVLTMELLEGIKLSEVDQLNEMHGDRREFARRGADLFLEMIFTDGFFHADPHPGNVLILPDGRIGLLDFGMVGRLDDRLREETEDLLMALVNHDSALITSLITRIGQVPPDVNETSLQNDLADFVAMYANQPLDRFSLSDALEEMIDLIFRYRIVLPAQVAMILKVFVTLEGTSKRLCPSFSLMQMVQHYQRKAILRRLSPMRRIKKMKRVFAEVEQLVEALPRRILSILTQVQAGKFDVHLDHRGLEPSVNRLVLGMLASALFMGSTLLLSQKVPPLIFRAPTIFGMQDISILGLTGCMVSLLLGLRLFIAIGKSGHLDRRQ